MFKHTLEEQLTGYYSFHSARINKIMHFIGIPLVLYSLLVLLGWVHIRIPGFFDMPLSWLLSIALLAYYFFFDILLTLGLAVFLLILNIIASLTSHNAPTLFSLQLFIYPLIVGIILVIIGHFFERKKPSLVANIKPFLSAPIFIITEIFFYLGLKEHLKEKIKMNLSLGA